MARDAEQEAVWQHRAAEQEAARADAVKSFLTNMLVAADPTQTKGRDVRVREVLDDASAKLDAGFMLGDPAADAELRATIAQTYFNLGYHKPAIPHYEWLLDYHEREFGPEARETLRVQLRLGESYLEGAGFETSSYEQAEALYTLCLERALRAHGEDHELTLAAMNGLAAAWTLTGRHEESMSLHEEVFQNVQAALGPEHELLVDAALKLGVVYYQEGRFEEAEPLFLKALQRARQLHGDESFVTIRIRELLADRIYRQTRRQEQAEQLMWETLDHARRGLGHEHPQTNRIVRVLSRMLVEQGKTERAEQLLRDTIAGYHQIRAVERYDTLRVVEKFALVLEKQGKGEEGIRVWKDGIDRAIAAHGDEHAMIANHLFRLAAWLGRTGDVTGALEMGRRAADITERVFGPDHEYVAKGLQRLAWALNRDGSEYAEAVSLYRRALDIRRNALGETHRETIRTSITLAYALRYLGSCVEGLDILQDRVERIHEELGEEHASSLWAGRFLTGLLSRCGHYDAGLAVAEQILTVQLRHHGDDSSEVALAWYYLGLNRFQAGDAAGAVEAFREATRIYDGLGGQTVPARRLEARRYLAQALIAFGEGGETESVARSAVEGYGELDGDWRFYEALARRTLGHALVEAGRPEQAEPLLRECIETLKELNRRIYSSIAESILGQCLTAQQRFAEAEPLLLGSYRTLSDFYPPTWYEVRAALKRIVALYDAWGEPAMAAQWRTQLDAADGLSADR